MSFTDGTLLGGRVRYRQPRAGYRTGIEPVLLAASVSARPGERLLEAGTGAGAALLCLHARLPGVACQGIERDPDLAALARFNLGQNGFTGTAVELGDVLALPATPRFHHAVANPPWHHERATPSPDPMRDAAKRAMPDLLGQWAASLAGALHHAGSLTLIVPASAAARLLAATERAGCGSPALLPLWPRAGRPARLVLVRTIKGGRGGCQLLAGLPLHDDAGYTAAARAVLWDGSALAWD